MLTVIIILALATAFGLWRRAVDGKVKDVATPAEAQVEESPKRLISDGDPTTDSNAPVASTAPSGAHRSAGVELEHVDHAGEPGYLGAEDIGDALGDRATMVQFSSAFCQPCRATRQILGEVAKLVPGVSHVEIDAEAHLDLVRRLHIMRTPTVLILDGEGLIRKRASGQPRKVDVLAALGEMIPAEPVTEPEPSVEPVSAVSPEGAQRGHS